MTSQQQMQAHDPELVTEGPQPFKDKGREMICGRADGRQWPCNIMKYLLRPKRLELLLDLTAELIIHLEVTKDCCPTAHSACLGTLSLREQYDSQPCLIWISHGITLIT